MLEKFYNHNGQISVLDAFKTFLTINDLNYAHFRMISEQSQTWPLFHLGDGH